MVFLDAEADPPSLGEFELLLEDKAFVDHFNIFLSQPVFGQQILYSYIEKEFEFEPPIRRRRYFINRRAVINWLRQERFPLFRCSRIYVQYLLCARLRDIGFHIQNPDGSDQSETPEETRIFTRNLLGSVIGMQLFRDSLRATRGDRVFDCWMDIETFRRTSDVTKRRLQLQLIKSRYIVDGAPLDLIGIKKNLVSYGKLNFDIVPDNLLDVFDILKNLPFSDGMFCAETDSALETLASLLFYALNKYWAPRHVLHVLKVTPVEKLKLLFQGQDEEISIEVVEKMVRCRHLFPRSTSEQADFLDFGLEESYIVQNSSNPEPARSSSPCEVSPEDLLSLWGGRPKRTDMEGFTTVDTYSRPWSAVSWTDDGVSRTDSLGQTRDSSVSFDSVSGPSLPGVLHSFQSSPTVNLPDNSLSRMILSNLEARKLENMPLLLKNYILGRRDSVTDAPRVKNRTMCALASDHLAGCPFLKFLKHKKLHIEINYLNFWNDVRCYLRIDEMAVDRFGNNSKKLMARTIAERYLMTPEDDEGAIFAEGLKMALLDTLSRGDDESLLFAAHDIVSSALNITWRKFVTADSRKFVKGACGKKFEAYVNSLKSPPAASVKRRPNKSPVFFGEARGRVLSSAMYSDNSSPSPTVSRSPSPMDDSGHYHNIGEANKMKAFEHAVTLSEEVNMMPSVYNISDLVFCMSASHGSINTDVEEVHTNEWVRVLIFGRPIDIANIKVSREVILPQVVVPQSEKPPDFVGPRGNRLVVRRNGIVVAMPTKPRSFSEVLTDTNHFEFFKRFLLVRKITAPLQFWKAVEDLKDTPHYKSRHMKATNIFRRFFGKQAKHGATLECNDEVIRQIPYMDSITPGMMLCAQASIFRMMERKWYPGYLETFPIDTNMHDITPVPSVFNANEMDQDKIMSEWMPRRKEKKLKTFHLWRNLMNTIREFLRSMNQPDQVLLFEMFLRKELETLPSSEKLMETRDGARGLRDNMQQETSVPMTRVVVRNKVIVINKLPQDLQFWQEVKRFKQQAEGVASSRYFCKEEMELLQEKAQAIVTCFLASDVPPRIQINIPTELAVSISNNIMIMGAQRGMFHDACILIFPVLHHFWKRFKEEWMGSHNLKSLLDQYMKTHRKQDTLPHPSRSVPNFLGLKIKDYRTFLTQTGDDEVFRINFTMTHGIRLIYPKSRSNWKSEDKPAEATEGSSASRLKTSKGGKPSAVSLVSQHSRIVNTAMSRKMSANREGERSGRLSKELSRISDDSPAMTPEVTRNKARRLSAMVENLNVTQGIKVVPSRPRSRAH